jgi:hypothetical protein
MATVSGLHGGVAEVQTSLCRGNQGQVQFILSYVPLARKNCLNRSSYLPSSEKAFFMQGNINILK